MKTCSLDYETRSTCDLKVAGAYVYARHPSTKVLCAAYSIDGGLPRFWPAAAGHAMPKDLAAALANPKVEMHAWNAQFERLITRHVLGIDVPMERWRCSAALARARGIPGKLADALEYLGHAVSLSEKRRGNRIMLKWCKPLSTGGWADDPGEYEELLRYCIEDVRSEMLVADALVPLSKVELADYLLCERINDTGLPVDRELALACTRYGDVERRELNALLSERTGGAVRTVSQHGSVKAWLKSKLEPDIFKKYFVRVVTKKDDAGTPHEHRKETTDKAARVDFLLSEDAKEAHPDVVEVIELVDDAGKSSVAKYVRIAARSEDTGRAEGSYMWAGAIQTKRYSSVGVQVHNFPRAVPDDIQQAIVDVETGAIEQGFVMAALASLLRPTIMAPAGRVLVWGDWSSVEARGMPWLAGHQPKLDMYRNGTDVYRVNAQDIFGTPYADVPGDQRQIGKVAELSLQFGGARGALKAMARGYGIGLTDGKADDIVQGWRRANAWAMRFSTALYQAFMMTVLGTDTAHGPVSYRQINPMLLDSVSVACDLPDGTTLYYHGIRGEIGTRSGIRGRRYAIVDGMDGWDGHAVDSWETDVTFQKALPGGFRTERIWHGLLAENVTQAICAGLLRDCLGRVERALAAARIDAFVVGHTHDELILEAAVKHAARARNTLTREMVRVPKWMSGFPLGCDVKSGPRYTK